MDTSIDWLNSHWYSPSSVRSAAASWSASAAGSVAGARAAFLAAGRQAGAGLARRSARGGGGAQAEGGAMARVLFSFMTVSRKRGSVDGARSMSPPGRGVQPIAAPRAGAYMWLRATAPSVALATVAGSGSGGGAVEPGQADPRPAAAGRCGGRARPPARSSGSWRGRAACRGGGSAPTAPPARRGISMARSVSAALGAKASTMVRTWSGWMLHMRV